MRRFSPLVAGLGLALGLWASSASGASALQPPAEKPAETKPGDTKPAEVKPAEPKQPETAPADKPGTPTEAFVYVLMTTSMGDVTIELNNEKAPISTQNFLAYADKKFYDGTIFHRVIDNFMIQGGGFTPDMKQKSTDKPIKNEWQNGLKNTRGTLAMARLGDQRPNPKTVDSATSQFFVNVKDNSFLDNVQADGGAYAVFGKVVAGMDVVDKIKGVKTGRKGFHDDVPAETVEIKSIRRMTADEIAKFKEGSKK